MDISGHRKIELQSPLDLTYLQSNISRSARAKLDLNLPPLQSSDEDKLRKRVEELVDEYLHKTFEYAKQNIIINGLDATSSTLDISTQDPQTSEIEEHEPYTPHLASRIQTLHSTLESETLRLTQLRRTAPATAAANFKSAFLSSLENDSRFVEEWCVMAQGAAAAAREGEGEGEGDKMEGDVVGGLGRVRFEREQEVRGVFERGVRGLGREKGAMTETAARLERARAAVGEVEGRGVLRGMDGDGGVSE